MQGAKKPERGIFDRRDFLKISALCGGALVMGGNFTPGFAEEPFPSEKVAWIVGHAPGGGEDIVARGIAPFLEQYLKTLSPHPERIEVVIKNMPGGVVMRSINTLHQAKPDGYTIANGSEALFSRAVLGTLGFDLFDVTFLGALSSGKKVLVTNKKTNLNTWDDVVQASKKAPLKVGIGGFGASNHVAAILFIETARLPARIIMFEGTAQVNSLLIRGDLQLAMHSYDSIKHLIDIKELRPIVTFSESIKLPGVQNVKEIGFPQLNDVLSSQRYLIAPPKLPANIRKTYGDAIMKLKTDKEFVAWNEKARLNFDPVVGADFEKLVKNIFDLYKSKEEILRKYLEKKA